jgi:hypothetical protein
MSAVHGPVGLVHDARDLAQMLLAKLPQRWRHTMGVARRAEEVREIVEASVDGEILVAAAWLHDIGYADVVRESGFHPLDGGLHLQRHGWPPRIAGLVAHHSEALSIARVRGLADDLTRLPQENSMVADALTYADQTVGPDGQLMPFEERLADMLRRHGPHSPNAIAHPERTPLLRAAVHRIERRLSESRRSSSVAHR